MDLYDDLLIDAGVFFFVQKKLNSDRDQNALKLLGLTLLTS